MQLRGWQLAALAACIFGVAFLVPGWFYWNTIHAHWARCVYGDPACSLTVTTYALTCLTAAAFIAAFRAASFAKETIEHEKTAMLALNACQREKEHERKTLELSLLAAPNAQFVEGPTPPGTWIVTSFDCHNVGRSPVIDGKLGIALTPHETASSRMPVKKVINLGNLLPGKWIHVKIHFHIGLHRYGFGWQKAEHKVAEEIGLYTGTAELLGKPIVRKPPAPTPTPPQAPAPPTMGP